MTNKPMLSVERELRALAEKACGTAKDSPEYRRFLEAVNPTIVLDLTDNPANQQQGKPVSAILLSDCEEGVMQDYGHVFFATDDCVKQLYAEQPAPVAVVMPERCNERDHAGDFTYEATGWNSCLDAIARLNGVRT